MHVALARKYRPRTFADLIGQEHVARALLGAVEQGRVAHGYLLCGPRGVGKTTAARILAMALNCETRHAGKHTGGEPCGTCASCERIWAGSASLDVVEIDAASNRGVDDARELRERAMYAASQEGRHKIYIVDEAHMLTREAWNTLLKVLEEPPPGVVFVFATTEPNKITNTAAPVMSRLQRFDFRRVGPEAIGKRLAAVAAQEGIAIERDAVEVIARLADGGLRDALSVLDQVTAFGGGPITAAGVRGVLGLVGDDVFGELLDIVASRRAEAVFPFVAKLVDAGIDLVTFAEGAGDLWRAALAIRLGAVPDGVSTVLVATIRERADDLAPGDLLRILRSLEESEEIIRRGQTPRLTIELLLVRWAMMDRTIDIAELLKGRESAIGNRQSAAAPAADSRLPIAGSSATPIADSRLPIPGSADVESVRQHWPRILDALRADRKMVVAETLSGVYIADLQEGVVRIQTTDEHQIETIERYRGAIESAASRVLGREVRVGVQGQGPPKSPTADSRFPTSDSRSSPEPRPASPEPRAPKPERLSVSGAQAERARTLRGKDPALDSAMDALDLELLD